MSVLVPQIADCTSNINHMVAVSRQQQVGLCQFGVEMNEQAKGIVVETHILTLQLLTTCH